MSDQRSPKGYDMVKVIDEDKCLGCGICEAMCPEFAIRLDPQQTKKEEEESVAHAQ